MPKCPGMDPNFWKHSDIRENLCPHCGSPVEFWKDDVKRTCPNCNKILFNPNLGTSCLAWCESAADCLGNMDVEEWKKHQASKRIANIEGTISFRDDWDYKKDRRDRKPL